MCDKLILLEIFGIRLAFILLYICFSLGILQSFYLIWLESKGSFKEILKYNPILLLVVFFVAEVYSSQFLIYPKSALYIIILNGMYYSLFTCKLIINNTAKRNIHFFDIDIIVYILGIFAGIYLGNKIFEILIILGLTIWLCYRYYYHIIMAIFKMLEYLKISF